MQRFRAGFATAQLSITHPIELAGYGDERIATETHDSLGVTALVLSDGATTVGIASLDVFLVSRETRAAISDRLGERGVPLDSLTVAATHTHSGPHLPNRTIELKPSHRDKDVDQAFLREVERTTADALETAHANLEPASLQFGRAETTAASENRRRVGPMSDEPRVPAGEIDPEVHVLRVATDSGAELVVYNFACHPVCLTASEARVSADWPGVVADRIDAEIGAETLFLNGATGDINPLDWSIDRDSDAMYEFMTETGETIADAVLAGYQDARTASPADCAPITVDQREVRFDVKAVPDTESLVERRETLRSERDAADGNRESQRLERDLSYVEELLALADWGCSRFPVTLQHVSVGPVGLLGVPAEVFVGHGLDLKAAASEPLMPVGYANGYIGYIPTLADLERVGYEVRTSVIAPESIVEFRRICREMV
jgi:hypothetical protein